MTLADVVRLTPGVQVRDAGGPGQLGSLRIRGLRSDAAAVLVDGVRLRDAASSQADITGFFSNLGVIDFDRVEVLRGSASSLYGTNAIGGAINIVTREGGPQRSEGQFEFGSLGHSRVRGTTGGTFAGGRVTYSAGGLHWLVRDGVDGDDCARSAGGQGSVRAQLDAATSLGVPHLRIERSRPDQREPDRRRRAGRQHPGRRRSSTRSPSRPTQLERANAGRRSRSATPRSSPAATIPTTPRLALPDDRDHAAPRRVRSRQLAGQLSARRHAPPLRRAARPRLPDATLSVSEFDGDIDTFEARGHLQPASWLTVTGRLRARARALRRPAGRQRRRWRAAADRRRDQPDGARGVRRGAVLGARSPAQIALAGRLQAFRYGTLDLRRPAPITLRRRRRRGPPRALTGDVSVAYLIQCSGTKLRGHVGNAYRAPALYERFGGGFFGRSRQRAGVLLGLRRSAAAPRSLSLVRRRRRPVRWPAAASSSPASAFAIDVQSLTAFDFSGGIDPATDPYGRFLGYLNGSGGSSSGLELRSTCGRRDAAHLRLLHLHAGPDRRRADVPDFFIVPGVLAHTASLYVTQQWIGARRHDVRPALPAANRTARSSPAAGRAPTAIRASRRPASRPASG